MMTRARAMTTAVVLFLSVTGSLGTLGSLIFEEVWAGALYGTAVAGGATWLSVGTYRNERKHG